MTIYLDLIFLLNFAFDFILLMVVKILLKRNIKIYRLILGALFGALSIFLLFLKINSLELFAFKILISFIMLFISFGYKDIRYFAFNFFYLYMVSIVLGGFLYFLNITFSYKQNGLIFFNKGLSINFIFLLIFSPIILYIYIRQHKIIKTNYSHYYDVKITFLNGRNINLTAFLDTGNKLRSPFSNNPIILVNKSKLKGVIAIRDPILVPINTVNEHSLLKCFKIKYLEIMGVSYQNVLVGVSEKEINIDGVDCLLNSLIMEDIK